MPLPMTMDERKALARFRWPMVSLVKAKVATTPTASDQESAPTPRNER